MSERSGREVSETLVRPLIVVEGYPRSNSGFCFGEAVEVVLPDALLLEASEEAFDHAVLFGCVGCDVLLLETVLLAGCSEPSAQEDQAVVTSQRWPLLALWEDHAEPLETAGLQGALCLVCPASKGELIADNLTVVAVDDCGEVCPAIGAAVDVRQVHRPALIASLCSTAPLLDARPRCVLALSDHPSLQLHEPIDLLLGDGDAELVAQPHPDTSVAVGWEALDERLDLLDKDFIQLRL